MRSPRRKVADDERLKTPLQSPLGSAPAFHTLKESPSMLQASQRRKTDENGRAGIPPSPDIFESWRISANDTTETILLAAVEKYGIDAPWQSFSLWLVCDDTEIQFGMAERPSILFKQLRKDGKSPMFMLRRKEPSLDFNPKRAPPQRPPTAKTGVDKPLPWLPNNPELSVHEDVVVSPSNPPHMPSLDDLKGHNQVEQQHDMPLNGTEKQANSDPLSGGLDHQGVSVAEDLFSGSSSPPVSNPEDEVQTSPQYSFTQGTTRKQGNPDTPPDQSHNMGKHDEAPQRYTEIQYTSQPISEASPRLPSFGDLQVDFSELETRFAEQNSESTPLPIEEAIQNPAPKEDNLLSAG